MLHRPGRRGVLVAVTPMRSATAIILAEQQAGWIEKLAVSNYEAWIRARPEMLDATRDLNGRLLQDGRSAGVPDKLLDEEDYDEGRWTCLLRAPGPQVGSAAFDNAVVNYAAWDYLRRKYPWILTSGYVARCDRSHSNE